MVIRIVDNEEYRTWSERHREYVHYFPGDVFEVVPYRHNPQKLYEVNLDKLSWHHFTKTPSVNSVKIFWISKEHTEIVSDIESLFEYNLPDELFKI